MQEDQWVLVEIWTYPNEEEGNIIQGTAAVSCLIFITGDEEDAGPTLKARQVSPNLTRLPGVRSDPSNEGLCLVTGDISTENLEVAILNLIERMASIA